MIRWRFQRVPTPRVSSSVAATVPLCSTARFNERVCSKRLIEPSREAQSPPRTIQWRLHCSIELGARLRWKLKDRERQGASRTVAATERRAPQSRKRRRLGPYSSPLARYHFYAPASNPDPVISSRSLAAKSDGARNAWSRNNSACFRSSESSSSRRCGATSPMLANRSFVNCK
jgi:hypothetical protein